MNGQRKERRTPGRKGGDEGWIGQRQLEKETEKSTLGGAAEAGKVRREENVNININEYLCPSTFSPEIALSHGILHQEFGWELKHKKMSRVASGDVAGPVAVPSAGYESGRHTLMAGPQIIHMIRTRVLGDHIHSYSEVRT